ncbi:MAG: SRPBCC domain-containing protein [Dyadobacter sp.]|uniref:SRPBCC family protein n=1 Tax=Dyadobacter sp. TaxID=1914288 RepID=UPI0032632206
MTKTIKHQFFFPHPPETVWEYLTKPELMGLWLMKNNFQPVLGHDFQFRTNPIPSLNFDGIFHCTVLEIDPARKLSYSWRSGPGDGEITLDSVVVWQLQPTDKGTELFLEHSGFEREENLNFYNGLMDGWLKNLHKIANHLNAAPNGNTNA